MNRVAASDRGIAGTCEPRALPYRHKCNTVLSYFARSQVLTAVSKQMTVFWNVAPCTDVSEAVNTSVSQAVDPLHSSPCQSVCLTNPVFWNCRNRQLLKRSQTRRTGYVCCSWCNLLTCLPFLPSWSTNTVVIHDSFSRDSGSSNPLDCSWFRYG